jgi:trafficking protein particle complex subunit 10
MGFMYLWQDEVLYEVDASSQNWMVAGRKRGHVSLSKEQGDFLKILFHFLTGCQSVSFSFLTSIYVLIKILTGTVITGSRIEITVTCVPLVSGYVHPPQLGLPEVGEQNISCNPAGPHLVCVLPPALSSSYCIPV